MLKGFCLFVFIALLATPCYPADVVFGRRVYAAPGRRSYEQIWTLDTGSRRTEQLTHTQRRHGAPACSPDGTRIWFLSGAFGDDLNTELWRFDPRTRAETLAVRFGGFGIDRLLGGNQARAFFTAYEGHVLGLYRWDGHLTKLASVAGAALAPDTRSLAVEIQPGSVTMMEPDGTQGRAQEKCSGPAWSPDGRRLACVAGQIVRVLNLTTGVEGAHAEFTQRPTSPTVADFAADGTRLLVGTLGANHTSTFPQSDFWVLEIATGNWTFMGPGQSAVFAPGGEVLLVPPRELQPVRKVHEWVSPLLLVDPATHAQTPVATGTGTNGEPCRCTVHVQH